MQDDTTNTNVEEVVGENLVADESQPIVEEAVSEQNEAVEEVAEQEAPAEVVQEEQNEAPEKPSADQPSRRETLRIQQLLKKYGPPPETPQPSQFKRDDALDYGSALDADPEIIQRLEADRTAEGEARYQQGQNDVRAELRTSEWRTLLNFDAPQTEAKYDWLNPKKPETFDPALADAVNEEYKAVVGYDERTGLVSRPDIRYSDFIEARVELSTRLAKSMTADTAKNIAKQAAQTGVRPDGSSAKRLNLNKAPQEMTTEELYAAIGQKPPKK